MAMVGGVLPSHFDEVPLADLVTFVLRVEQEKEDLSILGELVVDLVHYKVEVMIMD